MNLEEKLRKFGAVNRFVSLDSTRLCTSEFLYFFSLFQFNVFVSRCKSHCFTLVCVIAALFLKLFVTRQNMSFESFADDCADLIACMWKTKKRKINVGIIVTYSLQLHFEFQTLRSLFIGASIMQNSLLVCGLSQERNEKWFRELLKTYYYYYSDNIVAICLMLVCLIDVVVAATADFFFIHSKHIPPSKWIVFLCVVHPESFGIRDSFCAITLEPYCMHCLWCESLSKQFYCLHFVDIDRLIPWVVLRQ